MVVNNASVNNNLSIDPPISNDAANPNPRSANDSQSQGSSNLRRKIDLAWKYVALQIVNGKPQYQCLFCLQVFNGGGIHRMKKHLAKITGDVKKYPKVPYDMEKQMESLLKEIQTNKNKRKVIFSEEGGDELEDAIDEAIAQEEQQRTSSQQGVGGDPKKKVKVTPPMFAPRTTPGAQPSIKSVLQNKEAIHEVDKRFAWWLLDCKISFNAVMSLFFQDMLDGVVGIGPGYKVHLLADLKRECQMLVDSHRSAWKKTGCTLMADGWTDQRQRTLINFLVYCSKDISSMAHISNLATRASKITVFVYNHMIFLSWLRKRPHWREIVRPGATRFATVFITLKSIFDFQAMKEIYLYRDRKESFDRPEAIRAASELKPDEWWRLFGGSAPCLQKIAVRILSQASALSGCEIDADLYQSGGGSSGLYAASLDSSAQEGGNEGEDHPTGADLQQVLANFDY
ncbi:uncharacterized protein [Arachis hypogaea]|uniref:uncharacterized protein n=1 Tax=Arachis hypogaea TaxID=3818 RepID=UPI003B2185B1